MAEANIIENDPADETTVQELIDWIVGGAPPSSDTRQIVTGICDHLVALDVAIDRFMLFVYTLHPNLEGRRFRWIRGEGVDIASAPMGMFRTEIYTASPLPDVIANRQPIRRHLERSDCPDDYNIVSELREQGLPTIWPNRWSSRRERFTPAPGRRTGRAVSATAIWQSWLGLPIRWRG